MAVFTSNTFNVGVLSSPTYPALLAKLLNFAETATRNWDYGGHTVPEPFDTNYGYWEYTNSFYEPWLFDRPESYRTLYRITNDSRWLTQANSDAAWYESRVDTSGIFTPKGAGDTKYSYVHEWRTTDANEDCYDAWIADFPATYSIDQFFWTERECGLALMAAVNYYALTGSSAAETRINDLIDQWDLVRNGHRAPLHTLRQHSESFSDPWQNEMMSSPWMSGLYFQAARKAHDLLNIPQVLEQVSAYFDWMDDKAFLDATDIHPQLAGRTAVYYLVGDDLYFEPETPGWSDLHHALDESGLIKFAIAAKQARSESTARAETRLAEMLDTADYSFDYWTRTTITLPMYRLSPPREFNWWCRGIGELYQL